MTTAILVAGVVSVGLLAAAMLRPPWRLPALLLAILAVPGNVDNLLPQMVLDPHPVANNTAPIVSVVDLLIGWALVLSLRERRSLSAVAPVGWLVWAALGVWVLASAAALLNAVQGADGAAALRGVVMIGRIPALLLLVMLLRREIGTGKWLATAMAVGLVALLVNGLYTSTTAEAPRFTAATFGRNGLSAALMVSALASAGLGADTWRRSRGKELAVSVGSFMLAGAGLFGAIATGTRMSLLASIPAVGLALAINRAWWSRRGAVALASIAGAVLAIGVGASLWTTEGGRALSVVTDPVETVDIVTDPEGQPWYEPVRTRTHWWRQALAMTTDDPLSGVGAFQWNHQRYLMDPEAQQIVADPHNTYLQLAAEYGLPVLGAYLLLLGSVVLGIVLTAWRDGIPTAGSWSLTMLTVGGLMMPVMELTNSYLFNVRLGALSWLLLGIAVTCSLVPFLTAGRTNTREPSGLVTAHESHPATNASGTT